MEGDGIDGYRDQIVTCDVGVSLHFKTLPLFMKYSRAQCYAYQYPNHFPFSTIPIYMSLLSFTCHM